jgi:ATP-dependent DNA helicase RecG
MLPSLVQLQKILQLEVQQKYNNKGVIGGLPKLLNFWEPNARREGLSDEFIGSIAARVRAYPELDGDRRPAAIGELLSMVKDEGAKSAKPPERPAGRATGGPSNRAPARPSDQRPERPGERRPERAEARAPERPNNREAGQPAENLSVAQAPETPVVRAPRPVAPRASRPPKPPKPKQPNPAPPNRRFEGQATLVEPVDPKPRTSAGPRPLRSADPVNGAVGLDAPLTVLHGVGPETAKDYARLGVFTLRDLLHYYPRRYDNYARMKTINRLEYGEDCTLIAAVKEVRERKFSGNRVMLKIILADGTGNVEVTEFNPYRKQLLTPGRQIVLSGKVDQYLGRLRIKPREWEKLDTELLNTGRIVPVYALTEGLYQRNIRNLTAQVVNHWAPRQDDPLPESMIAEAQLMPFGQALAQIHFPDNETGLTGAQHRLAFNELFALQIGVLRQRQRWQTIPAEPLAIRDEVLAAYLASLPFPLTGAQQKALTDIRQDLARAVPMNRLIQGDVGSGKTAVAATAMAITAAAGAQAAIMAPTSILAEQHFKTLSRLLAGVPIALLQGSTPASEREAIYAGLRNGRIGVVVGTHALIENPVEFARLGLVVIDEQHRFGVSQRAALRGKGTNPHLLVMTATPIPRTLALTIYGDLDLTVLDEMPPGRQPITTYLLHANERERGYEFVRREVRKGRQAYLIFPLVEESEKIEAKAAVEEHARLQRDIFPEFKLGLLHGRMKPDEKDAVMGAFRDNATQILVSTSVVEVGVDVPNATVILIDGANRFGLSQLHQFRGRVGRGEHASYCLLVSDSPNPEPDERLVAMEATQDGFVLAQKDLELRGPGDFLGTRQSGFSELRAAQLSDILTIEKARREAQRVFASDPDLSQPEHAGIRGMVEAFWSVGAGDVS